MATVRRSRVRSSDKRTLSAGPGLGASQAGPQPLSAVERGRIEQTLLRLLESIRDFTQSWPIARRNGSQISRELGIDRTTCQRLTMLARGERSPTAMLDGLPGPRMLRSVADAAEQAGSPVSQRTLAALRSAIDRFEEMLEPIGGSVSKLRKLLARPNGEEAVLGVGSPVGNIQGQELLFSAASVVMGKHSAATTVINLYDKHGVDDGRLRILTISGNHGFVAVPDAAPTVTLFRPDVDTPSGESPGPGRGWQTQPVVLERFTTAKWQVLRLNKKGGYAALAHEILGGEEPADYFMFGSSPVPDPSDSPERVKEVWAMLSVPTRSLVFDLYMHESIARRSIVSADVHLWQPNFESDPHGRWHTRLSQTPTIVQLGRGIGRVTAASNPAQAGLVRELFDRAGTDPEEYIGYRCEERFPIWRTGYRFEIDFGTRNVKRLPPAVVT